jgi:hypothetical protein
MKKSPPQKKTGKKCLFFYGDQLDHSSLYLLQVAAVLGNLVIIPSPYHYVEHLSLRKFPDLNSAEPEVSLEAHDDGGVDGAHQRHVDQRQRVRDRRQKDGLERSGTWIQ